MKKLMILGPGCPKCQRLAANAEQAAKDLGLEYELIKVTDIQQITALGVAMTPALVVDGNVKSSGRLLPADEIKKLLS